MESKRVMDVNVKPEKRDDIAKSLPDADDVVSEWFSQDHPDRLRKTCWRDHSQYREYHKSL